MGIFNRNALSIAQDSDFNDLCQLKNEWLFFKNFIATKKRGFFP